MWRKRRNQAKNKVEQNSVYCHGVDNVFLDVSAALSLQAVWTGTACFHHMRAVIICVPYRFPHILLCALIFCSCWSQQQQEKRAPLSITHGARSICIADVRGRSSSFTPSLLCVPQRDPVVSAPATALNWWQMLRAAGTAAQNTCVFTEPGPKALSVPLCGEALKAGKEASLSGAGLGARRRWSDVRLLTGAMRISPITSDDLQTRCETSVLSQDLEESFCWTERSLLAHFLALNTWP